MPMTWNESADAKLLLAILKTGNVKPDYDRIAQYLGPECTPIAAQRRIQRLKERACLDPTADDHPAVPSTPTRDGAGAIDPAPAQGTPASVPRKRGRPRKINKEEGDADADAPVTPKKRGRSKKVKPEQNEEDPHLKAEGDDGSQAVYQSIEDAYLMEEV